MKREGFCLQSIERRWIPEIGTKKIPCSSALWPPPSVFFVLPPARNDVLCHFAYQSVLKGIATVGESPSFLRPIDISISFAPFAPSSTLPMTAVVQPKNAWLRRVVPQLLLLLSLFVYHLLGAVTYRCLDEQIANITFSEVLFFQFVTLTTIGYGDVAPTTDAARVFTIAFSIIGIPLTMLLIANFGKFVNKAYWMIKMSNDPKIARSKLASDADMPIKTILILYLCTLIVGSLAVPHNGHRYTIDDVYFSFISFATVGLGDKLPELKSKVQSVFTCLYLTWGIMLATALVTALNRKFSTIHYLGRRFKACDVNVWMGDHCFTVSRLVSIVAQEFDAPPKEVRKMLQELDQLIGEATLRKQMSEELAPLAKIDEGFDELSSSFGLSAASVVVSRMNRRDSLVSTPGAPAQNLQTTSIPWPHGAVGDSRPHSHHSHVEEISSKLGTLSHRSPLRPVNPNISRASSRTDSPTVPPRNLYQTPTTPLQPFDNCRSAQPAAPSPLFGRSSHQHHHHRHHQQPSSQHVRTPCGAPRLPKRHIALYTEAFLRRSIEVKSDKKLGNGKYSKVYPARDLTTGRMLAIKAIDMTELSEEVRRKFLPREIECWKSLRHKSIVTMHAQYESPHMIFLVMEYGTSGDLLSYVQKFGALCESKAGLFLCQIIEGLNYMHSKGIAHRDIKLENIILFEKCVKLSDFGFVTKMGTFRPSTTFCGSKAYSAPELLMGQPYNPFLSDIWSVGVVGFVMATDAMPFDESLPNNMIVEQQKSRCYRRWFREYLAPSQKNRVVLPPHCIETLERMLIFEPNGRPTVSECLSLPWVAPYCTEPQPTHSLRVTPSPSPSHA
ncbi:unnamed protein product [Caenorhabditis auriculariae]|uniref:Protein kinase domain-containing protein n=1 Tax=Caenorhabditis auriculariae TaxID=2777116 RepID=A0A8S1HVB6_9PELO|nr:unnamed protein product [Caenorhabditis auriculariae]